jgi:hypothetical protein
VPAVNLGRCRCDAQTITLLCILRSRWTARMRWRRKSFKMTSTGTKIRGTDERSGARLGHLTRTTGRILHGSKLEYHLHFGLPTQWAGWLFDQSQRIILAMLTARWSDHATPQKVSMGFSRRDGAQKPFDAFHSWRGQTKPASNGQRARCVLSLQQSGVQNTPDEQARNAWPCSS